VNGLPPIDASLYPADVRKAGPKAERLYEAALGFERMLVSQLTTTLAQTAGADDGGDDSDSASQIYRGLLPGSLADSIQQGGGLGLAHDLYTSLGGGAAA
jgi:hypothetical protein